MRNPKGLCLKADFAGFLFLGLSGALITEKEPCGVLLAFSGFGRAARLQGEIPGDTAGIPGRKRAGKSPAVAPLSTLLSRFFRMATPLFSVTVSLFQDGRPAFQRYCLAFSEWPPRFSALLSRFFQDGRPAFSVTVSLFSGVLPIRRQWSGRQNNRSSWHGERGPGSHLSFQRLFRFLLQ